MEPFLGCYGWTPQDLGHGKEVVLKVDRLDARHCEGDGLDGVGRQAISSCKFHVFHVQNVFGQEGEALVKAVRTIWRQREQMRRVQGHFKGCHCALTLIDTTKFEKVSLRETWACNRKNYSLTLLVRKRVLESWS